MTPSTTTQNLLLWGAAFGVSVLLALLTGIATHWPEVGGIDWRSVWLDVIKVIVAEVPVVAAGLGLPRLGRESIAGLVSEVGHTQAQNVLEVEAVKQATGIGTAPLTAQQRRLIVADLKAELLRDPEGDDPPPRAPAGAAPHG